MHSHLHEFTPPPCIPGTRYFVFFPATLLLRVALQKLPIHDASAIHVASLASVVIACVGI